MAFPTGWTKRCPITIASGTVSEALTDWPLLLTEDNLPALIFDDANADGSDIRASSDEAGTAELAVEVVSFDPVGDTAQIWVKVPSVSAVADTVIYLWFGDADATIPAADSAFGSQAVWDNDFAAVWHLEESGNGTAGEYKDSTANANHGQGTAAPTRGTGKIGYGQDFAGSKSITTSDFLGAGALTVECWFKCDGGSENYGALAAQWGPPASASWDLRYNPTGKIGWHLYATGESYRETNSTIADGAWHHIAGVADGINGLLYLDGVQQGLSFASGRNNGTRSVTLGTDGDGNDWQEWLDSIRISSVARSAAWIAADYASQSSPGTFATAGAVTTITLNPVKVLFLNVSGTIKVVLTQAE